MASRDYLSCLKYVVECLRYAHENGAPWSKATCKKAVEYSHFEYLVYCHEHGAPLGRRHYEDCSAQNN
jgi:hypothetical protein